jgi:hypothetical protein
LRIRIRTRTRWVTSDPENAQGAFPCLIGEARKVNEPIFDSLAVVASIL